MTTFHIDNIGGGDCGFYAFAIGLISIIQQQNAEEKRSLTFDALISNAQGSGIDIDIDSIMSVDLHVLYKNPKKYEQELLNKFQMLLRHITAEKYKCSLSLLYSDSSKTENDIVSNESVGRFAELVDKFLSGDLKEDDASNNINSHKLNDIAKYNEFALSKPLISLAYHTSKLIDNDVKIRTGITYKDIKNIPIAQVGDKYRISQQIYVSAIVNAFKQSQLQLFLNVMSCVNNPGRWASHNDLKLIAEVLNLNLVVQGEENGAILEDIPTLTLINKNNIHWLTEISLPDLEFKPFQGVADYILRNYNNWLFLTNMQQNNILNKHDNQSSPKNDLEKQITQVVDAAASSVQNIEQIEKYKQLLIELIQLMFSMAEGSLSGKKKINIDDIDKASAEIIVTVAEDGTETQVVESDEDFAMRLQEAEFFKAGFRR